MLAILFPASELEGEGAVVSSVRAKYTTAKLNEKMLNSIPYQAEELRDLLIDLQRNRVSGTVYINTTINTQPQHQSRVIVWQDGEIVYGGVNIPQNNQEFAKKLLVSKYSPSWAEMVVKSAAQKLQNPNSFRELLEKIVQIRVIKWEEIETKVHTQVVQILEQALPYSGELHLKTTVQFDLSHGQEGRGLSWSQLMQDVSRRLQEWTALTPVVPCMYAVPQLARGLQAVTDSQVRQHLGEWVDGVRSLVDIAAELDQDPLVLARSYMVWAASGWVSLTSAIPPAQVAASTHTQRPIILSVDDSLVVQVMIKRVLCDRYQVLLASNALDALKVINNNPIALMLLDVTMPEVDGLDFCRTVRSIPKFKHLPIIMLTARTKFSDKLQGQVAGATRYLTKPFKPEQLLEIVEKFT